MTTEAKQRQRREQLAAAVIRHVGMLDMGHFMNPTRSTKYKKLSLDRLSQCGTTCCLAGMAHVLWPTVYKARLSMKLFDVTHLTALTAHLGLVATGAQHEFTWSDGSPLFWVTDWPDELRYRYIESNDSCEAAQCAVEAIEHFAKKPVG